MGEQMNNRLHNSSNPYQRNFKRVLCCCSAGLLRSPTAAYVLSQPPFNCNTRACGIVVDYALIPFDYVLAHWADEIVCMTEDQKRFIAASLDRFGIERKVICLNIADSYAYRDPKLIALISDGYAKSQG